MFMKIRSYSKKKKHRLAIGKNKYNGSKKKHAGTRIQTWVTAATTQCPNH